MADSKFDFTYLRQLVRRDSGIVLDSSKEYLVESRLVPLVREEGLTSIGHLIRTLKQENHSRLHKRVVEAFATNETHFYRDSHIFKVIEETILPEMVALRTKEKVLRIWSAACSSGQEPYSLAIMLMEHFPNLLNWRIEIMASDFSQEILYRAEKGVYSEFETRRGLSSRQVEQYFLKEGKTWCVRPEIRRMIKFQQINLIEEWPRLPAMDIIFLRNVLIYFDMNTRQKILENAKSILKPDGYLCMGVGESPENTNKGFQKIGVLKGMLFKRVCEE